MISGSPARVTSARPGRSPLPNTVRNGETVILVADCNNHNAHFWNQTAQTHEVAGTDDFLEGRAGNDTLDGGAIASG